MALKQLQDESITVAGTAIGITSSLLPGTDSTAKNVIEAKINVESGGPIRWNAFQDPTAGGSEGSHLAYAGATITVVGLRDLQKLRMIKDSGAADATVRVALFGTE